MSCWVIVGCALRIVQSQEKLQPLDSQVITWYLEEIGNEIETEDELIEQKQVIEKVVEYL